MKIPQRIRRNTCGKHVTVWFQDRTMWMVRTIKNNKNCLKEMAVRVAIPDMEFESTVVF